jgi:hypothetical protein
MRSQRLELAEQPHCSFICPRLQHDQTTDSYTWGASPRCENMVLYPSVPHYPMVLKLRFPVQICHFGVIPSSRFFWTTQMSPTFGTQPDGSASASFSAFCSASQPGSRSCVLSRGCAKMDSQRYLKFAGFLAKIQVRVDSMFQQNTHNTYLIFFWDEDFISQLGQNLPPHPPVLGSALSRSACCRITGIRSISCRRNVSETRFQWRQETTLDFRECIYIYIHIHSYV